MYEADIPPRIEDMKQACWAFNDVRSPLGGGYEIKSRSMEMKKTIVFAWSFLFDHEASPLRHIPHLNTRHMVLQLLGWMWAVAFSIAIGSYTVFAVSVVGHAVLIGAAAITVATYSVAANRPTLFLTGFGRRSDGEHL